MLSVHGSTPYAALFGRVPKLIRNFEECATPALDDATGGENSRSIHRLREIAVGNMTSGTAQDRLSRAMDSHTRPSAELLELKPGDRVEFYRDPPNKDVTGWRGPA